MVSIRAMNNTRAFLFGKKEGGIVMDRLTEAFFKLKKVINNISLPEAKSAWENGVLLNIDVYLDPNIISGIVERAKIERFLTENIGRKIEVTGDVNQLWCDSGKLELWGIKVDGKMTDRTKIIVMSQIPLQLQKGYTVSVKGILQGNNNGEWTLSCDKLEMIKPTEKWLIENRVTSLRESISSLKEELSPLQKKVSYGVTKKGKPYSERHMSILNREVISIKSCIKEHNDELIRFLDKLNNENGIKQKTPLRLIKGGLTCRR